jgi:23S rRNA (cytidine2498-2'-O)-methyltransferase
VCQVGAEAALKRELARAHPELRFAYSRPGFVTFKRTTGPVGPDVALEAVFARAYGLSLGHRDAGAVAAAWGAPVRLHAWTPDLDAAVRAAAPGRFLDGARARPGERVLDVIDLGDEPPWLGAHIHAAGRSPWPAGGYPVEVPADAPSRAYRKLEEAIAWSGAPVRAGDVAVEIGSAPGGASYALLRRGLEVVGVDPGAMAPVVLGYEGPSGNRFRHLAIPVGALRRDILPGRVDWLLLDVHLAPQVALHAVRRIVAALRRDLLGVLFTLKLNDWGMAAEVPALVARVAGMGLAGARATQLPSGGQEVCVHAETARGQARRRR